MLFKPKKTTTNPSTIHYVDLQDEAELLEVTGFAPGERHYLTLKDGGYLEMLEVWGTDLDYMGEEEVSRTLNGFFSWLTDKFEEGTFYTTTLPTNVDSQVYYLKKKLAEVRRELRTSLPERRLHQLRDREALLIEKMETQESIREEMYNTDFILFLFGEDTRQLDDAVLKATSGNMSLQPISPEKKEQIIKQYNNMNERV